MKISQRAKEAVRVRLLEAAARYFAEHGYEATNVNDVAAAAGVAKGTIYNYFESKDELFGGVLAEAARRAVDRYSAVKHEDSARAALKALAAADVSVLREEESFMKVLVAEAMNPRSETYASIIEHLSPFLDAVSEIIARGVEHGEVRGDRATIQLTLIFVGILTLLYVQHWKSGGSWPTLDEIPELSVETFLDGAGGRGSRARRRA